MKIDFNVDNIDSYISREIDSKPENQALIFTIILVINLIAFGYFGVYRGYKLYQSKVTHLNELVAIQENLENNLATINKYEPFVENNSGVAAIQRAIPIEPTNSEFLRDISTLYSVNGYALQRISVGKLNGNVGTTTVSTQSSGNLLRLPDLVSALESMERFASIQNIRINSLTSDDGEVILNMVFNIYFIEKANL